MKGSLGIIFPKEYIKGTNRNDLVPFSITNREAEVHRFDSNDALIAKGDCHALSPVYVSDAI